MKKLQRKKQIKYIKNISIKLMKVVDTNGDGKISFEEFWQWW